MTTAASTDIGGSLRAIADLAREPGGGLIVPPDNFSYVHRALIFALAARHRVPAVYPLRFMVREGGLVSYGVELGETFPRAAEYIDRILQGEGHGEAARRHARRGADRAACAYEILQFPERRTEGPLQFAPFGVPADGVKEDASRRAQA
jgi:ABC-type uncharacterized transport system substrate-binding protein